jgi:hypothetical protein
MSQVNGKWQIFHTFNLIPLLAIHYYITCFLNSTEKMSEIALLLFLSTVLQYKRDNFNRSLEFLFFILKK